MSSRISPPHSHATCCLALLLLLVLAMPGCSRFATVRQRDGTELHGQITRSDYDKVELRAADGQLYRVWRDAVLDVEHPGLGLQVAGSSTMVAGGALVAVAAVISARAFGEAMAGAMVRALFRQPASSSGTSSVEADLYGGSGLALAAVGLGILLYGRHVAVQSKIAWHFPTAPPLPPPDAATPTGQFAPWPARELQP